MKILAPTHTADEHLAFDMLIDSLKQASTAAVALGKLREDNRWHKVAQSFTTTIDLVYRLMEESTLRSPQ